MAEKTLSIILAAKNQASGPINKVKGDISTLDRVAGRAGQGIRTLGSNLRNMAVGAGIGVAVAGFAAIKSGLGSLAERENVISATTAAIKAQGAAATVSAGQVRNWSEELEKATGAAVDDKAIQASANTLIRTGAIAEASFKRTLAAAVDLGAGLKVGPETGARMLAKALADPIKGMTTLRRAGVVLNEAEQKRVRDLIKGNKVQEAQGEILAAVEKRYKGAAAASAGPYARALNLLADASEDAKMALAEGFLPIIEKVADRLSTALADPGTIEDIRGLGRSIAGSFDAVLDASAQIPWDSIKSAMQLAGKGAKAAFDLFTGLPPWVQTAVLTGWGLNKLTGGALGSIAGIVGELGKGLIKGVLGMNAGVVNINAAVANGPGGIPGIGGKGGVPPIAGAGTAAGLGLGGSLAAIAAGTAVSALAIMGLGELSNQLSTPEQKSAMQQRIIDENLRKRRPPSIVPISRRVGTDAADAFRGLADQRRGERGGAIQSAIEKEQSAIGRLEASTAPSMKSAAAHLAELKSMQMGQAGRDASNAALIASAIGRLERVIGSPVPVTVTITASDVIDNTNRRRRIVKPGGPRRSIGGVGGPQL